MIIDYHKRGKKKSKHVLDVGIFFIILTTKRILAKSFKIKMSSNLQLCFVAFNIGINYVLKKFGLKHYSSTNLPHTSPSPLSNVK
jgi:hypothetical protein